MHHNFKAYAYKENFQDSFGINLEKSDEILVFKSNGHILVFDATKYEKKDVIDL